MKKSFIPVLILIAVATVLVTRLYFVCCRLPYDSIKISPSISPHFLSEKEKTQLIIDGHHNFGFTLINKLVLQNPKTNVVISPTSLSLALSMLYQGSDGQTKINLAKVLRLGNIDNDSLNNIIYGLYSQSNTDDKVTVNINNSLWQSIKIPVLSTFSDNLQKYFRAENFSVDFKDGASVAEQANSWISGKTNGKIKGILDPANINEKTLALIINTVYFKGLWTKPFDKSLTKKDTFYANDNEKENVKMMKIEGVFEYLENNIFQAIRLPYGESEEYGMYIFLPKNNLQTFIKSLTAKNWEYWTRTMSDQATVQYNGTLIMPLLKLDYRVDNDLLLALSDMGMADAFTPKANFARMVQSSSIPYFVDQIIHKTIVEVDEKGSEAAAATAILPKSGGGNPNIIIKSFFMKVDRPFLFAISDKNGEILFLGDINRIGAQ